MNPPPENELAQLLEAGLLRSLRTYETGPPPYLSSSDHSQLLNFSSNDYLGLAQHPALKAEAMAAIEKHGTGATASRLVCGTFDYHRELEERIANLKQSDDARLFANGYATALGSITALVGKEDVVILDKLSHASLIDAAKLSGAKLRVFPHNNLERLEHILKNERTKKPNARLLIVTESVFSMDGDLCPLSEIIVLKNTHGALLFLDEAHALGILGENGLGLAEQIGEQHQVDFQMGTLGKAAGSAGGYLAANQSSIDLITNKARSFIYSTAPPPAQVAASLAGINLIVSSEGAKLRQRLRANTATFQPTHPSATPIIPLIFGDNERALEASERLRDQSFLVPAIRYPTVPKNTARLRVTLSAVHSEAQVQSLYTAVQSLLSQTN